MTIGILKSPDPRNRNSIAVIIRNLYPSLRWTLCSPLWKSPTRDVTSHWQADWTTDFLRDVIAPFSPAPPPPIYDEFHVQDVLIVLQYMWRINSKGTDSNKSNLMNYRWAIPETIPGNFISISMLCSAFARHFLAAAAYLINLTRPRQHYSSWLLVFTRRFWLFCHLHMGHW